MQIRTIGKPSIDTVLSQIVERYETQFPGRLRACYLTGSYAEGNAVEWSDKAADRNIHAAPFRKREKGWS